MESFYFIGFHDKEGKFWFIEKGHDSSYTVTQDFAKADIKRVYYPDNDYPIGDYYFQKVKSVFPDAKVFQIRFQPVFDTITDEKERPVYKTDAPPVMYFDWNAEKCMIKKGGK